MKLLFLLLMVIACHATNAQQMNGIGPFKIGTTTTIIIDSLKNKGYSYTENPDWMDMLRQKHTKSITLLIEETSGFIKNSKTRRTKDFSVYNIGTIDGKGPKTDNLILSFYKDTLCSIILNDYEKSFTQSIKDRIGLPQDSIHKANANCMNFKNLVIADTIATYKSNADIRIFEARGFYYDKLCNKKLKHFFEWSNPAIMKKLAKSSNSFDLIFPYLFL